MNVLSINSVDSVHGVQQEDWATHAFQVPPRKPLYEGMPR